MSSIEQLFAEVYANPDDDQVRRVLADALLATGDPRGELILFQLEPDKDYHRRAMRLVQAHGLSWLGALRGKVIPLAYERGFLASVSLQLQLQIRPIDFDLPIWGTVHTIDLEDADLDTFQITPVMRSLKTLIGLTPFRIADLRNLQPETTKRLELVALPEPPTLSNERYDLANE